MAIDGPELFENDFAGAFVKEVARHGAEHVYRALNDVIDRWDEYQDIDAGVEAWAAVEMVAAAANEPRARGTGEPREYAHAIEVVRSGVEMHAGFMESCIQVMVRVAGENSELPELLEESGQRGDWQVRVDDLLGRLRRALGRCST
jgi:hypothetical protein